MLSLWLVFRFLEGREGVDGLDGGGYCSGLSLVYFGRMASSEGEAKKSWRNPPPKVGSPEPALNQPHGEDLSSPVMNPTLF